MLNRFQDTYYMYLPQLMVWRPYENWVFRTNTNAAYTMLDNGAFEGALTDANKLIDMAAKLSINEVAIPDVMGDLEGTVKALQRFDDETRAARIVHGTRLRYMGIVQGSTIDECMDCVNEIAQYSYISTIALPKILMRKMARTARIQLAAYIRKVYGDRYDIHLLGASPLWPQEIKAARRYDIRGIDTSLPYFYAYYDKDISEAMDDERPEGYFNLSPSSFSDILDSNLQKFWEWCND